MRKKRATTFVKDMSEMRKKKNLFLN